MSGAFRRVGRAIHRIMRTLAVLNPEHISDEEAQSFEHRVAARTVLFNDDGTIALLFVRADGYHKLPGGGVEAGETIRDGLVREVREEVGCGIAVGDEIGTVLEYCGGTKTLQESHTFFGTVAGDMGEPAFDAFERERGFELVWVTLDDARELLRDEHPTAYNGRFIVARDLLILEEAKRVRAARARA